MKPVHQPVPGLECDLVAAYSAAAIFPDILQ
jgi:hypothetical protein